MEPCRRRTVTEELELADEMETEEQESNHQTCDISGTYH